MTDKVLSFKVHCTDCNDEYTINSYPRYCNNCASRNINISDLGIWRHTVCDELVQLEIETLTYYDATKTIAKDGTVCIEQGQLIETCDKEDGITRIYCPECECCVEKDSIY